MTPRLIAILGALVALTFVALMVNTAVRRPAIAPVTVNEDHPGRALYVKLGCFRCHGTSLEGTPKGPSLHDAAKRWDVAKIARFLENPDSARAADPRLAEQAHRYSEARMPAYPVRLELRESIAAYVLADGRSGQKPPG